MYVELFSEDNKYTLLNKMYSDYFKCRLYSVVPWKDMTEYLQKCEGILTFFRYCMSSQFYVWQILLLISYLHDVLFLPPCIWA